MTRIRIADSGNGIGTTTSVGNIALSGVWTWVKYRSTHRVAGERLQEYCEIWCIYNTDQLEFSLLYKFPYWIDRLRLTNIWRPSETPSVWRSEIYEHRIAPLTNGGRKIIIFKRIPSVTSMDFWIECSYRVESYPRLPWTRQNLWKNECWK